MKCLWLVESPGHWGRYRGNASQLCCCYVLLLVCVPTECCSGSHMRVNQCNVKHILYCQILPLFHIISACGGTDCKDVSICNIVSRHIYPSDFGRWAMPLCGGCRSKWTTCNWCGVELGMPSSSRWCWKSPWSALGQWGKTLLWQTTSKERERGLVTPKAVEMMVSLKTVHEMIYIYIQCIYCRTDPWHPGLGKATLAFQVVFKSWKTPSCTCSTGSPFKDMEAFQSTAYKCFFS